MFSSYRMRHMHILTLLIVVFLHLACATTPVTSSMRSLPSSAHTPSTDTCKRSCDVYDVTTIYRWNSISTFFSTTITAATEIVVLDDATNKTLFTSMVHNSDGYDNPVTSETGTPSQEISYTAVDGAIASTTLVWPTRFTAHPINYLWKGRLPISDEHGSQACVSASTYESRAYPPYKTTQVPAQTQHYDGTDYALVSVTHRGGPDIQRNLEDNVLQSCYMLNNGDDDAHWPQKPLYKVSARYLTVTSTARRKATEPTPAAAPAPAGEAEVFKANSATTRTPTAAWGPAAVPTKPLLVEESAAGITAAPTLRIGGQIYTAVYASGTDLAYNIDGRALRVGSTITVGAGLAAQTIALKTDARGALVVESASAGKTRTSTVGLPIASGPADDSGKGDHASASRTATGKIALQTVNEAGRTRSQFLLTLAIVVTWGIWSL